MKHFINLFLVTPQYLSIKQIYRRIYDNIFKSIQQMGSFRSEPQLKKNTFQMSSRDHSYASCQMCGWRKFMEDASLALSPFTYKNYSLFCVFDGHGGPEVAHFAKQHFPIQLQKNSNLKKGNFEEALKQTFLKIDQMLLTSEGQQQIQNSRKKQIELNNSSDAGSLKRVGCTALAALVTKDTIYIANAGDCRLVAYTYSKQCKQITKDHKPDDEIEQKRIKAAGGKIQYGRVNGCLNLTRAFGDLQFKDNKNLKLEEQIITSYPDIFKLSRDDLHYIIMGCDGIWQCKSSAKMTTWITQKLSSRMPLGKILEALMDQIVAKSSKDDLGTDNMSAILVKFDPKK